MAKHAEKVAHRARIAVEKWRGYWKDNIDNYHDTFNFVLGQQWTDAEADMLMTFNKIPLTFNKLAVLGNSVVGEMQMNTPQLQVLPGTGCDEETASIYELIVKDIMFSTPAKLVYDAAARQAVIGGFGGYHIGTEYKSDHSFDLDIAYFSNKDATQYFWDTGAETACKTDGMHAGWVSRMSRKKFKGVYGENIEQNIKVNGGVAASKEEVALATEPSSFSVDAFTWADDDAITIIDYFVRKYKNERLYKLSNGKSVTQDEMDDLIDKSMKYNAELQEQLGEYGLGVPGMEPLSPETEKPQDEVITLWDNGEMVRINESRSVKRSLIKHYKIAGDYILDESEFPSEQLPVVFVDQNSYFDKTGKQVCRSFLEDVKDAQRYINYLGTQSAYVLKVSRFDQWIGSKANVQGLDTQSDWRDPSNFQGMLTYDESPTGARPEQIRPPELSQSLLTQYQRAMEDMYTSTGLYPARLGMDGNEISGRAIKARTQQGSYSTNIPINNRNIAIAVGGEIVNEMIPKVYDSERYLTLMTPEGKREIVVNHQADEYGARVENDIRKGQYQVKLIAGPSYEGQKEQALESLNMILQANPQLLTLIADLYAENLPLANTIELKNRLRTIVPPQIIEAGKTGKMPEQEQQGPSPEQQAMEMEQQQNQQELMIKQKEIEIKQQELQLKAQQQQIELEMEMKKLETERLEVAGRIQEQELRYMAETERTQSDAAIAHADNLTKILTHNIRM